MLISYHDFEMLGEAAEWKVSGDQINKFLDQCRILLVRRIEAHFQELEQSVVQNVQKSTYDATLKGRLKNWWSGLWKGGQPATEARRPNPGYTSEFVLEFAPFVDHQVLTELHDILMEGPVEAAVQAVQAQLGRLKEKILSSVNLVFQQLIQQATQRSRDWEKKARADRAAVPDLEPPVPAAAEPAAQPEPVPPMPADAGRPNVKGKPRTRRPRPKVQPEIKPEPQVEPEPEPESKPGPEVVPPPTPAPEPEAPAPTPEPAPEPAAPAPETPKKRGLNVGGSRQVSSGRAGKLQRLANDQEKLGGLAPGTGKAVEALEPRQRGWFSRFLTGVDNNREVDQIRRHPNMPQVVQWLQNYKPEIWEMIGKKLDTDAMESPESFEDLARQVQGLPPKDRSEAPAEGFIQNRRRLVEALRRQRLEG